MQLRYIIVLLILSFAQNSWAEIDRFEELYIWKMSEVLKLDAKKESEFSEIIKKMNKEKTKQLEALDKLNKKMASATKEEQAKKLVEEYKSCLGKYQKVNLDEILELEKIFNQKQLAKYLSYKSEVLKKLQERLSSGG